MTKTSITALVVLVSVFIAIIWGVVKIATDSAMPQSGTYLMPAEFVQMVEFNATQPAFLCAIAFLVSQAVLLFMNKENERATLGVLIFGFLAPLSVFLLDKDIKNEMVTVGLTLMAFFLGIVSFLVYAESGKNAWSMVRALSVFCAGAMIFVAYKLLFFV